MSKTTPRAREIRYEGLDEMLADVDQLITSSYAKHRNWTLGQAAGHVADWARFPMDGFPTPPAPLRVLFWGMRKFGYAQKMADDILANGFKPGQPTAPATIPSADASDHEGIEKLHAVVEQLKQHNGALHPSPLFGEMDKETLIHVTLLHAAHHFGYFTPGTAG